MPFCRALVFSLLCASIGLAADLRTLNGLTLKGDVVSASNKEIVLKTATDQVTTRIEQVLELDLGKMSGLPKDSKYTDVELNDGTLFHCSQIAFKSKEITLTLLADKGAGSTITLPVEAVSYIQKDAQDEKLRHEWKDRFLGKKRDHDLVIVKRGELFEGLDGTLGDADAEGKTIEFTTSAGTKLAAPLERVQGIVFLRSADANAAPVICKFYDSSANVLMVSTLAYTDKGWAVTTPSGAKVAYSPDQAARLDFSKDKLTYLSDDTFWKGGLVKVIQSSNFAGIEGPFRDKVLDKNLAKSSIRLDGTTYPRGLSLYARTELEFTLAGEYREFKAVIGVDEQICGEESPNTVVKIEGDGKELFSAVMSRKDKPKPITLNIKDVQKLRLIVSSDEVYDLCKHIEFADAKVSK